eukprot:gene82-3475_t
MDAMTAKILRGAIVSSRTGNDSNESSAHVWVDEFDRRTHRHVTMIIWANPGEFDYELAALHEQCVPSLLLHARSLGLTLEVLDFTYCATPGDGQDPRTLEYINALLLESKVGGNGPLLLCMVGQRQGPILLPSTLTHPEFESLCKEICNEHEKRSVLQSWYLKDQTSAVYRLQSLHDKLPALFETDSSQSSIKQQQNAMQEWNGVTKTLAQIMKIASDIMQGGVSHHSSGNEPKSALETYISTAILAGDRAKDCIIAQRIFDDIPSRSGDQALSQFVEDVQGSLDLHAIQELDSFLLRANSMMQDDDIVSRIIPWKPNFGINMKDGDHQNYVDAFQAHIKDRLKEKLNNAATTVLPTDNIVDDITDHSRYSAELLKDNPSLDHTLAGLEQYFGRNQVVFVQSPPGSIHSAMTAALTLKCKHHSQDEVVCTRYCGLSPTSDSLHNIVLSLCQQLARLVGRNSEAAPHLLNQLPAFFVSLLKEVHHHVTVTLFASVILVNDIPVPWIVDSFPSAPMIQLETLPASEAKRFVMDNLTHIGVKLTEQYQQVVLNALNTCTSVLYVRLLTYLAKTPFLSILLKSKPFPTSTSQLIECYLELIEDDCGKVVSAACFSYVALSRFGLCRHELLDILSLDNEALLACARIQKLSKSVRFPAGRLVRWLQLAKPLIIMLRSQDGIFIRMVDSCVVQVIATRYVRAEQALIAFHTLSDYWKGTWSKIPKPLWQTHSTFRHVPNQPLEIGTAILRPNARALVELPHALLHCKSVDALEDNVFFNFEFLRTYITYFPFASVHTVLRIPNMLSNGHDSRDKDLNSCRMVADALNLAEHVLSSEPEQLAAQLLGRLQDVAQYDSNIQMLLEQATQFVQNQSHNRCIPDFACMMSPKSNTKVIDMVYEHITGLGFAHGAPVIISEQLEILCHKKPIIIPLPFPSREISCIATSHDYIALVFPGSSEVFALQTGQQLSRISQGGHSATFSSTGDVMLVDTSSITCWTITGDLLVRITLDSGDHIETVAASATHVLGISDKNIIFWRFSEPETPSTAAISSGVTFYNLHTFCMLILPKPHSRLLTQTFCLFFSCNHIALNDLQELREYHFGFQAVTALITSDQSEICVNEKVHPLVLPEEIYILAVSPGSSIIGLACHNTVRVLTYDVIKSEISLLRVINLPILPSEVELLAVDDDGNFLAATEEDQIYLSSQTPEAYNSRHSTSYLPDSVTALAFSTKLDYAIGCSRNGYRQFDLHYASASSSIIGCFVVHPGALPACLCIEKTNNQAICVNGSRWCAVDITSLEICSKSDCNDDSTTSPILAIAVHGQDEHVISLHDDRYFRVWSSGGSLLNTSDFAIESSLWPVRHMTSGPQVALITYNSMCSIVDPEVLQCDTQLPYDNVNAILASGSTVAVAQEPPLLLTGHPSPVLHLAINDDILLAALASETMSETISVKCPITYLSITKACESVIIMSNNVEVWQRDGINRIGRFVADHKVGTVQSRISHTSQNMLYLSLAGEMVVTLTLPHLAKERARMRGVSMFGHVSVNPQELLKQRKGLRDTKHRQDFHKDEPPAGKVSVLERPCWVVCQRNVNGEDNVILPSHLRHHASTHLEAIQQKTEAASTSSNLPANPDSVVNSMDVVEKEPVTQTDSPVQLSQPSRKKKSCICCTIV